MKALRWSLQLHKWIALVVGVQVLFWVGGGLVMTALPIERVRGEHRAAEVAAPPIDLQAVLGVEEAARRAGVGPVKKAELRHTPRGPVWTLTSGRGPARTVSALDGRPLDGFDRGEAARLAAAAYAGPGRPRSAVYLEVAPEETGRTGALWRVDFDDPEKTTFYLAPDTGEVVTKRSEVWRLFDFFWRLHVMDWDDGEDFNHPLIVVTAGLTLVIVATGFVLLWIRLGREWRGRQMAARAK
jgi:uncharacterized iron-regulated membrane protein